MSNKIIIYTSNPDRTPKRLQDVIDFAKVTNKFRICEVGLNAYLADVKPGDNILTKKGNSIYVIKTFDRPVDQLTGEDAEYLDNLVRNYDVKKVNITSAAHVTKYGEWSKFAKPLVNDNKVKTTMTKNSFRNLGDRMKEMFVPSEADGVRITMDGNIAVATPNGYNVIDINNELASYPEECVLDLPAYVICKPLAQLKVGDVIALDRSYAKVTKIVGSKLTCIGYTGSGKTIHTVKDVLFNQTMVRVVISLAGTVDGATNPILLMALAGKGDNDSLLPFLMMQQNGGQIASNPMMMYMLMGKDKGNLSDLMMMSAFTGGDNPFANLFRTPVAPAVPVAPVANASEVPGSEVNPEN